MRKTRIVSILDTPVPPFPLSAVSPAKRVAVKAKKFPS